MEANERLCPRCHKILKYSTPTMMRSAEKRESLCRSCAVEKRKAEGKVPRKFGKDNPAFGKSVYQMWIEKYGEKEADQRMEALREKHRQNWHNMPTERKAKMDQTGSIGAHIGKKMIDVYINRYGEVLGRQKYDEDIEKHKEIAHKQTGERNPQFGKPAPLKSGNGWSGWYKGWYFRSLLELSFMINVIEKNNRKWVTAESTDMAIPYTTYEGRSATYFADFVLDDFELIEVKPESLRKSKSVSLKEAAAIEWCKTKNLIYKIYTEFDFDRIGLDVLKKMYAEKIITFIPRVDKKFKERYYE